MNPSFRSALDDALHWEQTTPDRVWLTQPTGQDRVQTLTWGAALAEARRVATHLRSLGLEPQSRIAIVSNNCAHLILSELAIWMAGHVTVALYPTLNAETVRYILDHSEAKLVFVGPVEDWEQMQAGVPQGLPRVSLPQSSADSAEDWGAIAAAHEPLDDLPAIVPEQPALIVYTSGSTGQPKGVMHGFGGIAAATTGFAEVLGAGPEDRMLSYLPMAHVYERAVVVMMGLRSGMQIFFSEGLHAFGADLKRARPTIFVSVPRLWLKFQQTVHANVPPESLERLLSDPDSASRVRSEVLSTLGLDSARLAVSGSAPIPPELIDWYRDLGFELLEGYGMSEDFAYSHCSRPGGGRSGYVGSPMPGVDVRLSRDGEVLVRSPANMLGYFKQPELTDGCYDEDGYFRTGDRGERDEEGRLRITGRVKELFKTSKGKYVAPSPIENLINASDVVESCVVVGSGRPQPCGLVVLPEALRTRLGHEPELRRVDSILEALLRDVNQRIEAFEKLEFLAVVKQGWSIENGFLTPTLKIRRSALESAYEPKLDPWYASEKAIVWEE